MNPGFSNRTFSARVTVNLEQLKSLEHLEHLKQLELHATPGPGTPPTAPQRCGRSSSDWVESAFQHPRPVRPSPQQWALDLNGSRLPTGATVLPRRCRHHGDMRGPNDAGVAPSHGPAHGVRRDGAGAEKRAGPSHSDMRGPGSNGPNDAGVAPSHVGGCRDGVGGAGKRAGKLHSGMRRAVRHGTARRLPPLLASTLAIVRCRGVVGARGVLNRPRRAWSPRPPQLRAAQ
ncbi:hypothetical protein B0H21DRAFT_828666 [Amylocystis lapponica]|nr:hypothetical protein B0H21DRAFT_828666 [Amylocystis lapponica]